MSKYSNKVASRGREKPPPVEPKSHLTPDDLWRMREAGCTTTQISVASHFSAGVLFRKREGVWQVASVTDGRFPREVKIPGGTNKFAPTEDPWFTLVRELGEELNVTIDHRFPTEPVDTLERQGHRQFFYLVREWSGDVREGSFSERDGGTMSARWISLSEFWQKCFQRHKPSFKKAFEVFMKTCDDPSFRAQGIAAGII